jgi:hypothetical protein
MGRSRISRKEADRLIAGQDVPAQTVFPTVAGMDSQSAQYSLILSARKKRGEIQSFEYETHLILLSSKFNCHYRPDFVVRLANGEIEYHECKSRPNSHGLVKTFWAAELFDGHTWVIATPKKGKKKGQVSFLTKRFQANPSGRKHVQRGENK